MEGAAEVQFAHLLAANEKTTRDIGVKKLKKWFYAKSAGEKPFTEMELLRIWKGLFYCFWMSDKPLIQEELSERIGAMIDTFATEECALLFLKTFLTTMLREWFGLDKWRMDKFMMLVRRFVRGALKYNKEREWNTELATKMADHYRQDLYFYSEPNGIGFTMHLAGLFMEELAKVGGEEVSREIIEIYMEPFYEVLVGTDEKRLRETVIVSVFQYLLRQSDCGIEYDAGKDIEEMGEVVEVLKEEDLNEDEGIVIDKAEEMENEVKSEAKAPVLDPRAGNVSVEIPQLNVDYAKISQKLFDLGSNSPYILPSIRDKIYKLSEEFKSVSEGVFPLTDEISDDEVEKIDIAAEVEKLYKREERIKKKLEAENLELQKVMEQRAHEEEMRMQEMEESAAREAEFENEFGSDDDEEENGVKRKMVNGDGDSDDEEDEDEPETKKAKTEEEKRKAKESSKELRRKQKREQRRRKRERLLAEEMVKAEERRKADLLINKELEIQSAVSEHKVKQPKQKIKEVATPVSKVNTELTNEKKEKKKKEEKIVLEPEPVKNLVAADSITDETETEDVKKKKKNKSVVEPEPVKEQVLEPFWQRNGDAKKKKNKKKSEPEELVKEVIAEPTQQQDGVTKNKKKKKDKEATIEKVINQAPSTEQSELKKKKKKKDKKEALEIPKEVTKTEKIKDAAQPETKLIGKNKKKKKNVFEESSDWDTPLQTGEQEIVIPSKKYKGDVKLKAASESVAPSSPPQKGFADFSSPTITTPKISSHTAKFLKKAMSKSATPKKKLSQMDKIKFQVSSSDTKPKRVNWALTRNMFQGTEDLLASIKSSPGIPHDPAKQPEKGLLKRKSVSRTGSPALNPVALNTQLNAARTSKKGLKMQKRLSAQDFF